MYEGLQKTSDQDAELIVQSSHNAHQDASELRCDFLAHLEDLDGEGRVSGYRSRENHGAVAVNILARYPLHFLRYRAEDRADGALLWRLSGTQRGGGGRLATALPEHQNGCEQRTTKQDNDSKHGKLCVPNRAAKHQIFISLVLFLSWHSCRIMCWVVFLRLPVCSESDHLLGLGTFRNQLTLTSRDHSSEMTNVKTWLVLYLHNRSIPTQI